MPVDREEVYGLIQRYFPQEEWLNAWAVSNGETADLTQFENDSNPEVERSYGPFQININVHPLTKEQALDLETNVAYAANLYSEQGWRPWTVAQQLGLVDGGRTMEQDYLDELFGPMDVPEPTPTGMPTGARTSQIEEQLRRIQEDRDKLVQDAVEAALQPLQARRVQLREEWSQWGMTGDPLRKLEEDIKKVEDQITGIRADPYTAFASDFTRSSQLEQLDKQEGTLQTELLRAQREEAEPPKPTGPTTRVFDGNLYQWKPGTGGGGEWVKVMTAPAKATPPIIREVGGSVYQIQPDTGAVKLLIDGLASDVAKGRLGFDQATARFNQEMENRRLELQARQQALSGYNAANELMLQGSRWAAAPGLTHFPGWEQGGAAAQAARLLGSKFTPVPIQRIPFNPRGDVERILGGGGYNWSPVQTTFNVPPPAAKRTTETAATQMVVPGPRTGGPVPVPPPTPYTHPWLFQPGLNEPGREPMWPYPIPGPRGRPAVV